MLGYVQGGLNEIDSPTLQDFNSGSLLGYQYYATTIDPRTETRDSSQTSFLHSAANQGLTNLKVFTLTLAKKVVFDANKKATGVVVESNFILYSINAAKEVILSAGVFQSPSCLWSLVLVQLTSYVKSKSPLCRSTWRGTEYAGSYFLWTII